MPNWCDNTISITGPAEKLSPMYTKLKEDGDEGLLSILHPQPADIFKGDLGDKERQQCAKDGVPNWYDWNSSNWGTKWDPEVHLEFVDNGDGTAEINGWFDTAWGPPIEAFQTLVDDWDSCYIELMYEINTTYITLCRLCFRNIYFVKVELYIWILTCVTWVEAYFIYVKRQ